MTLEIALGPQLMAEEAEQIHNQGKEAVIFALLALAREIGPARNAVAAHGLCFYPLGDGASVPKAVGQRIAAKETGTQEGAGAPAAAAARWD